MIKPYHSLALLLSLGLMTLTLMFVFPENGITAGPLRFNFITINEFIAKDSIPTKTIEEILESTEIVIDSTKIKDSIKMAQLQYRKKMLRIQYKNDTPSLKNFFTALDKSKKRKVRIMHYGDSQIEGDRITSYLRNQLQKEFGGSGPGFIPAFQVIPNRTVDQTHSDNWKRYTAFGRKDTTMHHSKFGLLCSFSHYESTTSDSVSAWLSIAPSPLGYRRARRFNTLKMLLGNAPQPFFMEVYTNDSIQVFSDTLAAISGNKQIRISFRSTPKHIKVNFYGAQSPDIYGFSLESNSGVIVDNIGMRGSSGTIFRKIDRTLLHNQFNRENIKLVILQFGGNAVPYIESKERAINFGHSFQRQIKYLKSLLPKTDFIIIGPSDMSTKQKDKFITYPILPHVRDALKKAAFTENCGYWDIYEVMGGENSMPAWVGATPPLAGSDYVHFTNKGAKKIAELFHKALMEDYALYKKEKQIDTTANTVQNAK